MYNIKLDYTIKQHFRIRQGAIDKEKKIVLN